MCVLVFRYYLRYKEQRRGRRLVKKNACMHMRHIYIFKAAVLGLTFGYYVRNKFELD